jgi:hypothetical protein
MAFYLYSEKSGFCSPDEETNSSETESDEETTSETEETTSETEETTSEETTDLDSSESD